MRAEIISFTDAGFALAKRIKGIFTALGAQCGAACTHNNERLTARSWTEQVFGCADALIFVGATGIAVRSIAPHLRSKTTDPAVLVIDEKAGYVIPLVSGHIGGANELALRLAEALGAVPVVTTATDINNLFSIDTWATRQGMVIDNPEQIKWISARLLAGETIRLRSDFPVVGTPPKGVVLCSDGEYDAIVTLRTKGKQKALRMLPRILSVGVGCRKDISCEAIGEAFRMALAKGSLHEKAVRELCSIDLKAKEPGILEFCRSRALPFRTFSAQTLAGLKGNFTSSAFVQKVTGVDNVCERSAVAGSGGKLILKKNAGNGVTMAVAAPDFTIRF